MIIMQPKTMQKDKLKGVKAQPCCTNVLLTVPIEMVAHCQYKTVLINIPY